MRRRNCPAQAATPGNKPGRPAWARGGAWPWARYLLITLASGSIPGLLILILGRPSLGRFLAEWFEGVVFAMSISSLCWLVLPRIAEPVLRMRRAWKWISLISVIVALAAIGCGIADGIFVLVGRVSVAELWPSYVQSLKLAILITLGFGLAAFFHETFVARLREAEASLKAKDEAAERLRQAATEARLSSLESRIQPHFLFNTLNSVLTLIRESPAEAERMVERLASLLRFSLDANQARLVPLSLELKIVRDYLEIERARFGTRLRFSIQIPAELEELEVPPMSIQTLVENSVKHAVSVRRGGAFITIVAKWRENSPVIEVTDDGPGFRGSDLKPGHGLELLEGRMDALYGRDAALEMEALHAGGMRVSLLLPQLLPQDSAAGTVPVPQ